MQFTAELQTLLAVISHSTEKTEKLQGGEGQSKSPLSARPRSVFCTSVLPLCYTLPGAHEVSVKYLLEVKEGRRKTQI